MNTNWISARASEDFSRARFKESFDRILGLLDRDDRELLSFHDIRTLVKPRSESYRGMKAVPVANIVGSEGRYREFNRAFLPRHDRLRYRWERVDTAYLSDVILPPIKLYKIGEAYFVRDGNHRVSVAKAQGVQVIDAEVVELLTEIRVRPGMTRRQLQKLLVEYEKKEFYRETGLENIIPPEGFDFTAPGRYDEVLDHILVHKYFINQRTKEELPLEAAAKSWYEGLYTPIAAVIRESRVLRRFPGRTVPDLFLWIVSHWHFLKENYGADVTIEDAVDDYAQRFGKSFFRRLWDGIRKRFESFIKNR